LTALNAQRVGALAYYAAFSLAPILVIVIAVAGAVWGRDSVEGHLVSQFDGLLGPDGAKLVQQVVRASYLSPDQSLAALVGVLGTLFGASALFTELSDAVQSLFAASRQYRYAWLGLLMARLLGLALVVGLGGMVTATLFEIGKSQWHGLTARTQWGRSERPVHG
jgi:membrane protein